MPICASAPLHRTNWTRPSAGATIGVIIDPPELVPRLLTYMWLVGSVCPGGFRLPSGTMVTIDAISIGATVKVNVVLLPCGPEPGDGEPGALDPHPPTANRTASEAINRSMARPTGGRSDEGV